MDQSDLKMKLLKIRTNYHGKIDFEHIIYHSFLKSCLRLLQSTPTNALSTNKEGNKKVKAVNILLDCAF